MSFNTWLFLAVVFGSGLGYIIARAYACRYKILKYEKLPEYGEPQKREHVKSCSNSHMAPESFNHNTGEDMD
eukprot:Pgem_evm1s14634